VRGIKKGSSSGLPFLRRRGAAAGRHFVAFERRAIVGALRLPYLSEIKSVLRQLDATNRLAERLSERLDHLLARQEEDDAKRTLDRTEPSGRSTRRQDVS